MDDKEESDVDPEQSTGAGDSGSSGSSRDAAADEADDGLQNLSWTAESWLRSSKLLQTLAKSLLRKARRTKGGEDAKIKSLSLDNIRTAIHDAGIAEIVKSDVDELKEEVPDSAGFMFSIKTVADVYWHLDDLPASETIDGVKQIAQGHLASALPSTVWQTRYTSIVWLARWTLKGLQPSRPQVLFTQDMTLPAKKALKIT